MFIPALRSLSCRVRHSGQIQCRTASGKLSSLWPQQEQVLELGSHWLIWTKCLPAQSALYLTFWTKLNQAASPMCLANFPFFIMLGDFNFSNISAWFSSTIRFESLCWKSCRALVSFSYAFATSNFAFSRLREPLTFRLNDFCFLRKFRSARSKKRGLGISVNQIVRQP